MFLGYEGKEEEDTIPSRSCDYPGFDDQPLTLFGSDLESS